MSITSTRRVNSSNSSSSKVEKYFFEPNNHSQFVEHIDTNNNVLIKNEHSDDGQERRRQPSSPVTDFNSASPDISTSIEALALSGVFEESNEFPPNNNKVGVYTTNQSIIKDEEIERTGRSYLKHFYEKNEHPIDVDEFV